MIWLESLALVLGYGVVLGYALAFLRLSGTPWAFRWAWIVVLLMAAVVILTRLMVLIDPLVPTWGLAWFALHPFMGRVRAWLSLGAYLVLCVEFGRLLLRRGR